MLLICPLFQEVEKAKVLVVSEEQLRKLNASEDNKKGDRKGDLLYLMLST